MAKRRKFTRNDAYALLKELPYFEEIDRRIKANISISRIAKWIQEDRGGRVDVTRKSLEKQLFRYKRDLLPGEVMDKAPLFFQKHIEKLDHGFDEIEELENLYLLQLKRIDMNIVTEVKDGKLLSGTRAEIKLAVDILDKIIECKVKLGLLDHEPQKISFTGGLGVLALDGDEEEEDAESEERRLRLGLAAGKLLDALTKSFEDEDTE